jgi:hypothetical protein
MQKLHHSDPPQWFFVHLLSRVIGEAAISSTLQDLGVIHSSVFSPVLTLIPAVCHGQLVCP